MNSKVFQSLSYGVYIVTAYDARQGRFTGCTANSIMQVTSRPAVIAVSINRDNYTHTCIAESGALAVSILAEQSDPGVIGTFGFSSGREVDKLAQTPHRVENGAAVIHGCCGWFAGKVVGRAETASHTVFLIEATEGEVTGDGPPMTYRYYHQVIKGKTGKNAPTYQAEAEAPAPGPKTPAPEAGLPAATPGARWRCTVCGYVYPGEPPFEDLPDDWRCPVCRAPKSQFERLD